MESCGILELRRFRGPSALQGPISSARFPEVHTATRAALRWLLRSLPGVAALIKSKHLDWTPDQVEARLQQTADDIYLITLRLSFRESLEPVG